MRHDVLHPMGCACRSCRRPAEQSAVDPQDLDALRKGLIAGLWAGGMIAAGKYGPSIIDWMTSR